MFKILALDPGDKHIGIAISDELRIIATPYRTINPPDLINFLTKIITTEQINTIVIGLPKTMRGTNSQQTEKSISLKTDLEKIFPSLKLILWDERLSSKRANEIKRPKNKPDKLHQHSIAAATILQTYLDGLSMFENID